MMLSKIIPPLLLMVSNSHAFGPYPRQVNSIVVAATGTASGSVPSFTGISSGGSIITGSGLSASTSTSPLSLEGSITTTSDSSASTSISPSSSGGSIITSSSLSASASTSNSSSILTGSPSSIGASSSSLGGSSIQSSSTSSSGNSASNTPPPSTTTSSTGAAIVPITIKATDGSQHSTVVTWSAVETGSTSTKDSKGQPTIISPPFYVCNDPFCISTGCVLAILCSSGGGNGGSGGLPPPSPPPGPPPGPGDGSPSGSASQSPSKTDSASASSSTSSSSSSTSSSTSSTSSATCGSISTVADPGPTSVGDPDDGRRRRVRRGTLVPREAPVVSRIGSCPLATNVNIPSFSGYSAAMRLNNQPNGNNGANGRIYNAMEKWYVENLADDGTPFSGVKVDNAFNSVTGPGSTDHVWEKSNVGDFLASSLGSDFDCDDLNALFSLSCSGTNLLQRIFDQLPSMDPKNIQTGFVAMNRNLNGMKGWMFSQGYSDGRFNNIYGTNEKIVQGLERQVIIFNLFNSDSGIQSMHDQTNNRIYQAFLGLDNYISTNKIQRANSRGDLTKQFGPAFKAWYGQLLSNTGSAAYGWASSQVARLNLDKSVPDCLKKAINALQSSPLYGTAKFQIDQSHLSWVATPLALNKRDLFGRDGACTASTKTSTTPATTLSTVTSQTSGSSSMPSSVTSSSPSSSPSSSTASSSTAASSSVTSSATSSTSPSSSASASSASATCTGNQVQGTCVAGRLPSATPYSGTQGPSCDKAAGSGSPNPRINIKQAEDGASKYCAALAQGGVVLSADNNSPKPFVVPGAAENNNDLALLVLFDVSACPTDKSSSTVDFSKLSVQQCQTDLFSAVSEVCVQDSTWKDYNPQYTLEGGSFGADCAMWSMVAQPK